MIFPRRLTLALSLICCSQHANASTSSMKMSMSTAQASLNMTAQASSNMTPRASTNITAQASSDMMSKGSTSAVAKTYTVGTSSTIFKVGRTSTTATGVSTSITYMQNASFSIGTEYASPDCEFCSIGGTITVTMSCSIKINGSDDMKCDEKKFRDTGCEYVTLVDKSYRCADVKGNYTYYMEKNVNVAKDCDDVCPASGSVLYSQVVFTFASGIVVGMLSQTM